MDVGPRPPPVVERLRAMILSGQIRPGEELLEVATAARLGISRTPLRPALAALAQEGLLQRRGARGYVVRTVSMRDISDAFLVRAHLEGLACAIVARRGLNVAARSALRAELELGDDILRIGKDDKGERTRWREMNERFHGAILRETGNLPLVDVTARTLALPLLSSRVTHFEDPVALARSHEDHWTIFQAILSGDADRARAVMVEHILRSHDIIARSYDPKANRI
jgi:GntR family transcriptional regulator of vanillate catabolism